MENLQENRNNILILKKSDIELKNLQMKYVVKIKEL